MRPGGGATTWRLNGPHGPSQVEVLPGVASAPGGLYVVYPSRRHVPRAVTAFVDMVSKRITQVAPYTQDTHGVT